MAKEIIFNRTQDDRLDVVKSLKDTSHNAPGHKERLEDIRKRVQEEYFDNKKGK